jgi:hypothetical protein
MRPYLFVPLLREALEKAFEDDPFVAVYATKNLPRGQSWWPPLEGGDPESAGR